MEPRQHVALAPKTTLGVGGPARYFREARTDDELSEILHWARRRGVPFRVLGGGSNVVVSDSGFDGLVIQIALKGVHATGAQGRDIEVAAGEPWHAFVLAQAARGLQGVECLAGIPGLVGATPIQNVGAYGQEVCESIVRVVALDTERMSLVAFDHEALAFGYRDSFFKSKAPDRYIVTRVRFRLAPSAPPKLAYPELAKQVALWSEARQGRAPTLSELCQIVLALRGSKAMLLDPTSENGRSCGSFFVNPRVSEQVLARIAANFGGREVPHYPQKDGSIKLPAAWLIEQAGLGKGTRRGNVGLSTKHSLALVCHAGATAHEVMNFAREIQRTVQASFGVSLAPEPVFWGFDQAL